MLALASTCILTDDFWDKKLLYVVLTKLPERIRLRALRFQEYLNQLSMYNLIVLYLNQLSMYNLIVLYLNQLSMYNLIVLYLNQLSMYNFIVLYFNFEIK